MDNKVLEMLHYLASKDRTVVPDIIEKLIGELQTKVVEYDIEIAKLLKPKGSIEVEQKKDWVGGG